MAKPEKSAPAAEGDAPAKPKSKRLLLAALALVAVGAIGGAAWYFLAGSKHEEAPKEVVVEQPTFMVLEPFTVNLQHEENDQFLQIGITLKVASAGLADQLRQRLPELRSRLLFLLSSKRASELMPVEGKKKLAKEIIVEANGLLGGHSPAPAAHEGAPEAGEAGKEAAPAAEGGQAETATAAPPGASGKGGVLDVLFTSFIIQ